MERRLWILFHREALQMKRAIEIVVSIIAIAIVWRELSKSGIL